MPRIPDEAIRKYFSIDGAVQYAQDRPNEAGRVMKIFSMATFEVGVNLTKQRISDPLMELLPTTDLQKSPVSVALGK